MSSIYSFDGWSYGDPAPTADATVNALISELKWGDESIGTGIALTFSFPDVFTVSDNSSGFGTGAWDYGEGELDLGEQATGQAFSAIQQQAARDALQNWANVANLTFTEIPDVPDTDTSYNGDNSSVGDIRFAQSSALETAWAYYPSGPWGGDIWCNPANFSSPVVGNYAFHGFMHEIGHALGLEHPHDTDDGDVMSLSYDATKYSIMSYKDYVGDSNNGYNMSYYPITPMLYDVLAIQTLYGVNTTYNLGDTTYSWAPGEQIYECIWDAGGNDTLDASNQTQGVILSLTAGTFSSIGASMWNGQANVRDHLVIAFNAFIENAIGSGFNDELYGDGQGNSLTGLGGNDTLDGGTGADNMAGGVDDDVYYVDNTGDVVTEVAGQGTDTVISSLDWALGANLENLTLVGGAINGTGNSRDNVIVGNSANNTLNGLGGADTLIGGAGNDTYVVNEAGDVVVENPEEGNDTVQSAISYTLGADVENLTLTGSTDITGTGNTLDNILTGNNGNNVLTGNAGNDTIFGSGGADTLQGGQGNDLYTVNSVDDVVNEYVGEGTDTILSSVDWTLSANVENLTLTGSASINGTGNSQANLIIGNLGGNTLDGGAGADTLMGGAGNDYYLVAAGDVVIENLDEGYDTVQTNISWTLGANIEKLVLTGVAHATGIGNDLNNVILGNSGNNVLEGGLGNDDLSGRAGADTMLGGQGNDTYTVDNTGDVVTENPDEGIDLVRSSVDHSLSLHVENLILIDSGGNIDGTGNDLANSLIGNLGNNMLDGGLGNDTLKGGDGDDTLHGGLGDDRLIGGDGADQFMFDTALGVGNIDIITDFVSGLDTLVLDDLIFTSLGATVEVGELRMGDGVSTAADADDFLIFNTTSGALFYDADGAGGADAVKFAILKGGATLTHSDFSIS